MKVLHYIDDFNSIRMHKEYFEILARGMKEGDETHLLIPKPDYEVSLEGVTVHYLSYFKWMTRRNKKFFHNVMEEVNPDVLHFHCCWSRMTSNLITWNDRFYKRPYILSTHKMLMPWHNQCSLRRKVESKWYMDNVINTADAIVTDSVQEANIQSSRHITTIPNSLYAYNYSDEQMQHDYYQLLIALSNSKPYLFMSEEERRLEASLLRSAVSHTGRRDANRESDGQNEIEYNDSYRRIALHAYYEGTLNMLRPYLPSEAIEKADKSPHYSYNTNKNTDSLYSLRALTMKQAMESVKEEEAGTEDEKEVAKQIANVQYEIVHNIISQRHLIELFKTLRYTDYNEDTLNVMLQRLGNYQDAARIMQLMKDYYGLEEGFMPMEPLNDKITQQIKDKLLLWQVQA